MGRLQQLAVRARAEASASDAGSAFFGFFNEAVQESMTKQAFTDALDLPTRRWRRYAPR